MGQRPIYSLLLRSERVLLGGCCVAGSVEFCDDTGPVSDTIGWSLSSSLATWG
jgi:hypothetical protein